MAVVVVAACVGGRSTPPPASAAPAAVSGSPTSAALPTLVVPTLDVLPSLAEPSAALSAPPPTLPGSAPPVVPGATDFGPGASVDVCALLTSAEVEKIVGQKFVQSAAGAQFQIDQACTWSFVSGIPGVTRDVSLSV